MPYFITAILATVSAIVLLFSKYESNTSDVLSELERLKHQLITVDSYVSTYVNIGENLSEITAKKLSDNGILSSYVKLKEESSNSSSNSNGDNSKLFFESSDSSSDIFFQTIKNTDDDKFSSYYLLINFSAGEKFKDNLKFAEVYLARNVCEGILLGKAQKNYTVSNGTINKNNNGSNGGTTNTNNDNLEDGVFICQISK